MASSHLFEKRWFRVLITVVAFVGMALLAVYQRMTGPTYPVRVDETLAGSSVAGRLPRSHAGAGGAGVELLAPDPSIGGEIIWRRFPTDDPWRRTSMVRRGDMLVAELPHQIPAGKLEYSVQLVVGEGGGTERVVVPHGESAVIRFRGDVPAWILIPHIICMFLALTIVFRTGFGAAFGEENVARLIKWIMLFLVPGGLVLGPLVQKYAFGAYWTGWPFGDDWTDNKTLAAVLAWIAAWLIARYRERFTRVAILLALHVMVAVYLIPHSANGSEVDWDQLDEPALTSEAPAPASKDEPEAR